MGSLVLDVRFLVPAGKRKGRQPSIFFFFTKSNMASGAPTEGAAAPPSLVLLPADPPDSAQQLDDGASEDLNLNNAERNRDDEHKDDTVYNDDEMEDVVVERDEREEHEEPLAEDEGADNDEVTWFGERTRTRRLKPWLGGESHANEASVTTGVDVDYSSDESADDEAAASPTAFSGAFHSQMHAEQQLPIEYEHQDLSGTHLLVPPVPQEQLGIDIHHLVHYTVEELISRAWTLLPEDQRRNAYPPFSAMPPPPDLSRATISIDEVSQFLRECALEFAARYRTPTPVMLRSLVVQNAIRQSAQLDDADRKHVVRVAHGEDTAPEEPVDFDWVVAMVLDTHASTLPPGLVRRLLPLLDAIGVQSNSKAVHSQGMKSLFEHVACVFGSQCTEAAATNPAIVSDLQQMLLFLCRVALARAKLSFLLTLYELMYKMPHSLQQKVSVCFGHQWAHSLHDAMPQRFPLCLPSSQREWSPLVSFQHAWGDEERSSISIKAFCVDASVEVVTFFTSRGAYRISMLPPFATLATNPSLIVQHALGVAPHDGGTVAVLLGDGSVVVAKEQTLEVVASFAAPTGDVSLWTRGQFVQPHILISDSSKKCLQLNGEVCGAFSAPIEVAPLSSWTMEFWVMADPRVTTSKLSVLSIVDEKQAVYLCAELEMTNGVLKAKFAHCGNSFVTKGTSSAEPQWEHFAATYSYGPVSSWRVWHNGKPADSTSLPSGNTSGDSSGVAKSPYRLELLRGSFFGELCGVCLWSASRSRSDVCHGMAHGPGLDEGALSEGLLCWLPMDEGAGLCLCERVSGRLWLSSTNSLAWSTRSGRPLCNYAPQTLRVPCPVDWSAARVCSNEHEAVIVQGDSALWVDVNDGRVLRQRVLPPDVRALGLLYYNCSAQRLHSCVVESPLPEALRCRVQPQFVRGDASARHAIIEFWAAACS